ncbi:Coenzyme F420 hydrogenase/dehydrogenase, beta subunit C-terminal domain [Arthrobacter sp.]|uniref:Coenzyme F420 hydrogenase/dehydrogenase, beta subunit C-terminal domain n=1 Tax=Arthrobacter sp. TaxID=1667 RepID=UPI003A902393
MGSFVGVWKGHAVDPETRHRGSSAGVLTALTTWLLESGKATRVAGAGADRDPRRTVPVSITTKEEALASAGSRYAPTATLSNPDIQLPGTAVVGKPCEISALKSYVINAKANGNRPSTPILLSFFCAGTPSAHATQRLIESLGIAKSTVPDSLWYRGRGWPGRFTVQLRDITRSVSYDESWGKVLGPATQWRCKVCPDGVGESADIAVADFWQSDDSGYPIFVETDGSSAVIARTIRGRDLLLEAVSEGIIDLEPIDINSLAAVQPLQVQRRTGLLARLTGSLLAGRRIPLFTGFSLAKIARRQPRLFLRIARGTYQRVRSAGS